MNTGTPWRLKFSAMRLQRHRLAGAGRAGDEAVPVRHLRQEEALGAAVPGEEDGIGHGGVAAKREIGPV